MHSSLSFIVSSRTVMFSTASHITRSPVHRASTLWRLCASCCSSPSLCPSLTKVHGRGNAPAYGLSILAETPATIYHLPGATGWSYSLCDRPAVCWNPAFNPASPPRFDSGAFAFALTGSTDIPVRIEACDNLAAPIWTPPPAPRASTALSFRIERRALEVAKVVTPRAPRLRPRPCGRQLFSTHAHIR